MFKRVETMNQVKAATSSILLVLGLDSSPIQARETEIGNGGDALVCSWTGILPQFHSPISLDHFEAQTLMGLDPDFGDPSADAVTMALHAVRRLEHLDPVRYARMTAMINSFLSEARIVPNANLRDILDTDPSLIPHTCVLKQLAIQYPNPMPRMPRYLIDQSIWDALERIDKAYLILHEVIYFETAARGATDSRSARYFNAHLASNLFETWTDEQYQDFLRQVHLPSIVSYRGLDLDGDSIVRHDNGQIRSAEPLLWSIDSGVLLYGNMRLTFQTASEPKLYFDELGQLTGGDAHIEFIQNGVVVGQSSHLYEAYPEMRRNSATVFFIDPATNELTPSLSGYFVDIWWGSVANCGAMLSLATVRIPWDRSAATLQINGPGLRAWVGSRIECSESPKFINATEFITFDEVGRVRRTRAGLPSNLLPMVDGTLVDVAGRIVNFDENGRVTSLEN